MFKLTGNKIFTFLSHRGRKSWLLYLNCIITALWVSVFAYEICFFPRCAMDLPFPRCAMGLSFPRCAMDLRLWHYLVILIYFSYKSLATKTLYSHDVVQF